MAVRSLNKNGYGEQWDMPGYVASGGTSQINPQSVPVNPSGMQAMNNIATSDSAIAQPRPRTTGQPYKTNIPGGGTQTIYGTKPSLYQDVKGFEQELRAQGAQTGGTPITGSSSVSSGTLPGWSSAIDMGTSAIAQPQPIPKSRFVGRAGSFLPSGFLFDPVASERSAVEEFKNQLEAQNAISKVAGMSRDAQKKYSQDQIFDAQGNFISDSIQAEGAKAGQLTSPDYKKRFDAQKDIEDTYLFQNAPSNIVNPSTGMRWSLTMEKGKLISSDREKYNNQKNAEEEWLENARRYRLGTPGATEFMTGSELAAPKKEVQPILQSEIQGLSPEEIEMMFPGGQVPTDAGTSYAPSGTPRITTEMTDDQILQAQEDGEPITLPVLDVTTDTTTTDGDGTPMPPIPPMPGAGSLSGTDMDGTSIQGQWGSQELQDAWATVQSGQGVPNWAIRTVQVPYQTIDPSTGELVTINRTEISPETQLLLQENARIEGMRQSAEGRRLGQYQTILQNPRAAAAMRIMEQMGLGGIAQLLGTPQPQQIAPSMTGMNTDMLLQAQDEMGTPIVPGGSIQTQLLPEGMTPEQLRLIQMWGGENIPTTGFLSGADPERLAISQALQQIAGFSPEQTRMTAFGVTPGVTPSYQVPRLLAMRR